MKKILLLIFALVLGMELQAVTLQKTSSGDYISNDHYSLTLSSMGSLQRLRVGGKIYLMYGSQEFRANGEQKKFTGQYSANAPLINANNTRQSMKILSKTNDQIKISVELKKPFMTSTLVYTFDNTPVIKCQMSAEFKDAPSDWLYTLRLFNFSTEKDSMLLPGKSVPAVPYDWAYYQPGKNWKFAYSQTTKSGIGLVTGENCRGMEYYMNKNELGFNDLTVIRIVPDSLRTLTNTKKKSCSFYIIAGKMPIKDAYKYAGKCGMDGLSVTEFETEKLLCKPGERNAVNATISNTTGKEIRANLELYLQTKIDQRTLLIRKTVTVPAYASIPISADFATTKEMRGGASCRLLYSVGSNAPAEKNVSFAISDFAPESVKFAFVNVGSCHQAGSEQVWSDYLRRNKIGIIEYYLWMRSTIRGLVPKEDEWRPNTESPGYHRVLVKKKFIQEFVKRCKANGVTVISSITGLFNYKEALKDPEQILYCENGQPSLYNGIIYNNKTRVATFKVHGYTPEFVETWAKEMIESSKMFGWAGYRFDWYFIPDAPNDPLYLNTPSPDWRDMYGKTGKEYYPNPDKTAVERLTQYRSIMEKANPDFIYATNIHANAKSERRNPGYIKTASRKSLLIFEYMLGLNRAPHHTFQGWSTALAEDVQRVRVNGGQPAVGFARGFPYDSVSGNLVQYLCFAAGGKYAGTIIAPREQYVRDNFMTRYSEYYFSPDFLRIPEKERNTRFSLNQEYQIFFRPFICSRTLKSGVREETVHLINLPEGKEICQYYDTVPARDGLELTVTPRTGEKLISAFAAIPQSSTTIQLKIKNGKIVDLPKLTDAMIVVLRYGKK